jgi:hypothetical protein
MCVIRHTTSCNKLVRVCVRVGGEEREESGSEEQDIRGWADDYFHAVN